VLGCFKLKEMVSILKIMKKDVPPTTSLPQGIYTLQDNGLRCFVPPCFSWDVLDSNGQLIAKVSDVDFSYLQGSSDIQELQVSLANEGLRVRGYTIPLPESDGVRQAVRFIVESLEDNYRHRQ
jgi:hypothetical protein